MFFEFAEVRRAKSPALQGDRKRQPKGKRVVSRHAAQTVQQAATDAPPHLPGYEADCCKRAVKIRQVCQIVQAAIDAPAAG